MRLENLQAQFDAALAAILPDTVKPICLAVSGGGDSMALLHLAARSLLVSNANIHAFTVDHGLRPEAADEAAFVAGVCEELGIAHQTLRWTEPEASQAKARQARHRLLARAVSERDCALLLTGHTEGDNVESFLIRARAGSGWYGLAGMSTLSVSPVWPEGAGVYIFRPMLGMHRTGLRDWLKTQGLTWRDDPSNEDHKYERVRMRQLLTDAPGLSSSIARIQTKLSALRRARDKAIAEWLNSAERVDSGLALDFSQPLPAEALAQGLSIACMTVAGTDRPARNARSLSAANRLRSSLKMREALTLTLGGTVIRVVDETLVITRETNRRQGEISLNPPARLRHTCAGLTGAVPA